MPIRARGRGNFRPAPPVSRDETVVETRAGSEFEPVDRRAGRGACGSITVASPPDSGKCENCRGFCLTPVSSVCYKNPMGTDG